MMIAVFSSAVGTSWRGCYILRFRSVQSDWQYISLQGIGCYCWDICRKSSELSGFHGFYILPVSLFLLSTASFTSYSSTNSDCQAYGSCVSNNQNRTALSEEVESVFKSGIW